MKIIKSNFTIQNIVSLFSIIIGTNYYLSYHWLNGFFKMHGIENLAIVTLDDLTFLFAKYNIVIAELTALGFIGIFIVDIELYSKYKFIEDKKIKPMSDAKEGVKKLKENFRKDTLTKILVFFAAIIIIIGALFIVKIIVQFPQPHLLIFYIIILFVIPILYYLAPNIRKLIFLSQIILMFMWANLFINYVLEESSKSKVDKIVTISFNYDNKKVETNDTLNFVIQSYKYTILKGVNSYYFYNNSDIKNLKYAEKPIVVGLQSVTKSKEKI